MDDQAASAERGHLRAGVMAGGVGEMETRHDRVVVAELGPAGGYVGGAPTRSSE
jgi:hypothetical protein